jgi:hypothetical protein
LFYTYRINKYAAARDLTVDESMVGHKGRDYTVQYMPAKKAHRWGAKLWVLAESDTGWYVSLENLILYNLLIYRRMA